MELDELVLRQLGLRFAHGFLESGSCIGGAWIASANCATVRLWEMGRPGASQRQENEGPRRQVAKGSGSRGVVGAVVEVDVFKKIWAEEATLAEPSGNDGTFGEGGKAFRVVRGGRVVGVTARRRSR